MNFNFFEWMREGVKRAVLMGVTDAVATMGAPADDKTAKDKIMGFLQNDSAEENIAKRRIASNITPTAATSSRKLGRSITELSSASQ
ncbi:MAG: hypothetical protein LBK06_01020 [Planctomycetaceae bacterium]|jgi:hypothetical protein|nr:hypothetical protein [Planctomycetaceae bacterium]